MTKEAQHTRIKFLFVLAAIFLTVLSVLSYIRVQTLIDSSELVNHTQLVRLDLEEIRSSINEADRNQKNYLITGDSSMLLKRDSAIERSATVLASLTILVGDNPTQIENLRLLKADIDMKLSSQSEVIALHSQQPNGVEYIANVREGIKLTEAIENRIKRMMSEEENLLTARTTTLSKSIVLTPLLNISLVISAILILTITYFRLMRELKRADELTSSVEQSRQQLISINEVLQNKTNQLAEGQQLAHIGSWEWNVQTNKIEWSDELYRIYGLRPQEFHADYESFLKYIHPDDREYVNGIVQQAFKSHEAFAFTHRVLCPDGTLKFVSSTGKVFCDSNGNTIRMAGTAQDITAQKKYEEGLKESEERFLKIFEYSPVAMTLAEVKTNKIRYANRAFYAAFGYSEQEVIGNTSEDLKLIGPEENQRLSAIILDYLKETRTVAELQALSLEETEELLNKLKESGAMKNLEVLYTRKDGGTFPAIVSFELIRFGAQRYTIASYQDVTERKNAQELLSRQNTNLLRANKELESCNFISSHDLQEPLRQIQNFSSRLISNEKPNLTDTGQSYLEKINLAAGRMRTLITDLLTYSRATNSEQKFEVTNLNQIVNDVLADLKETIDEKHATIQLGDLGEARIIPFQFRQMMQNILGNALKFSKPGVHPSINIQSKLITAKEDFEGIIAGKDYHLISIADNGIGFEPQYKDRIFEVFQRLHDKDKIEGTGIGLSIVKKIAENHNGAVIAKGEPGKGATFDIWVPVG